MVEGEIKGHPESMQRLGEIAKVIGQFVATCTGPASGKDIHEHATKTGLLSLQLTPEYAALGAAFMRVMLSAYYRGARDATHPGEQQANIEELEHTVDGLYRRTHAGYPDSQGQPGPSSSESEPGSPK
jgi:hypothetical protein